MYNEIAYEIIFNSTSKFSKSFKKDVSKLLACLQDSNKLIEQNNMNDHLKLQLQLDYSINELKIKVEYEDKKDARIHEREMKQLEIEMKKNRS